MNDNQSSADFTLSDHAAQKLAALCAATGETLEDKLAAILEEMLEDKEKAIAILNRCDAQER